MPAEPLVDIEGPRGAPRAAPASVAPATSAITQERAGNGRLGLGFAVTTVLLGLAAGIVAGWLGTRGGEAAVEDAAAPLVFGFAEHGLGLARMVSAGAVALAVMAVAVAGRSFGRSSVAGLLAGALVLLDPATLTYGRLAVPTALVLACVAVAIACFAASRPWVPWLGALALGVGTFVDPRVLWCGPVLALFALLRGHIYASPRHLMVAGAQAILIPVLGLVLHALADGMLSSVPACLAPPYWAMLSLRAVVQPGDALVLLPNPVTWFAGLGALLFLGVGGAGFGASRFRLARANGRVQARLVAPFPAVFGRGIWLLLLAAALPIPQVWILLFALALALGVQDLGEDAPGFGLALAIALLLFAAIVLVRAWSGMTGTGGEAGVADAMGLVPWGRPVSC